MNKAEKEETSEALKTQADEATEILANAEKNGYLIPIELDVIDQDYINKNQATLEERIAYRTEKRNQEYLHYREIWSKNYTEAKLYSVGNYNKKICENYALRAACADKTLPLEEQQKNKQKLAEQIADMAYLNTSKFKENPDWQLKPEDIKHTKSIKDSAGGVLSYNFYQQTLFVNDAYLDSLKDSSDKIFVEAANGNQIAMNCLIYHELNHKQNWENDGLGQLSYTPVNSAKGTILTEKLSLCTEYLYMAKEYNERKAKGETTIKYNDGSEKPLETIIDLHPDLKETIEKYGSDINNPEIKKEIVKAAMNYWEQDRKNQYQDQIITEARWGDDFFSKCSFEKQVEILKNEEQTYQKVSEACLKNINIGNQQFDLTDCKDLIDTYSTEDAKQMIAEHNKENSDRTKAIMVPSYQEYQEINAYLESIGKKTDAEKMDHIAKTVQIVPHSLESYDKKLEDIILSHNPQITIGAANIERSKDKMILKITDYTFDFTEYATPKTTTKEAQTNKMPTNDLALDLGR